MFSLLLVAVLGQGPSHQLPPKPQVIPAPTKVLPTPVAPTKVPPAVVPPTPVPLPTPVAPTKVPPAVVPPTPVPLPTPVAPTKVPPAVVPPTPAPVPVPLPTPAPPVVMKVRKDSGIIGGFVLTNDGENGFVLTFPNANSILNNVNNININAIHATFPSPIILKKVAAGADSFQSDEYICSFGTLPNVTALQFHLVNGFAEAADTYVLNGAIVGVVTDRLPGLSFSLFEFNNGAGSVPGGAGGLMKITLTAPDVQEGKDYNTVGRVLRGAKGNIATGIAKFSQEQTVAAPTLRRPNPPSR